MNRGAFNSIPPFVLGLLLTFGSPTSVARASPEQNQVSNQASLEYGLTQQELVAAMTHVAFYAGWPSAHSGLLHLKGVLEKRKAQK